MIQFLKTHFYNIIASLVGVVGVAVAVITLLNEDSLELSITINSAKKIVDLEEKASMRNLSISHGDEKIKVLYLFDIRIENTGNKVILLEDFYKEEIMISTQDMTTKFITFDTETEKTGCVFRQYERL